MAGPRTGGPSVFGALMLDLYPKGPWVHSTIRSLAVQSRWTCESTGSTAVPYRVAAADASLGNLWVQGGARESGCSLPIRPRPRSPTQQDPVWSTGRSRYAYVNSCHSILPRHLNFAYDGPGRDRHLRAFCCTQSFCPRSSKASAIEKSRRAAFSHPDQFGPTMTGIAAAHTCGRHTQHAL